MPRICKDGIYKNVTNKDLESYLKIGFKKVASCLEPQPKQDDLYVVDDYTIAKK